jgi:hypothetical protein
MVNVSLGIWGLRFGIWNLGLEIWDLGLGPDSYRDWVLALKGCENLSLFYKSTKTHFKLKQVFV